MDEDRFNHVAAEVLALRIMIASFAVLTPNKEQLREYITMNADLTISALSTETEEQRKYIKMVQRKLNTFSELL